MSVSADDRATNPAVMLATATPSLRTSRLVVCIAESPAIIMLTLTMLSLQSPPDPSGL